MANNKPSYFEMSSSQSVEMKSFLSRGDGFFHIGSSEIPTIIPQGLRAKWDSAAVIVSGSNSTDGAMALVGHRIDTPAGMLDHDPFVIAVVSGDPTGSGVLVHHASFDSRSFELPQQYLSALSSSGLTEYNYFRDNPPFGLSSGSSTEVPKPLCQALDLAKSFITRST